MIRYARASSALNDLKDITLTQIQETIRTMGVAGKRDSEALSKVKGTKATASNSSPESSPLTATSSIDFHSFTSRSPSFPGRIP